MASQDKARITFQFFLRRLDNGESFSVEDLMRETDWVESTVKTYLGKQWREFVEKRDDKMYVRPDFKRLTEEDFLALARQKRLIFQKYKRIKYREILTYEFLLPLTREDQLRKALDSLFYKDTIQQRLREIRLSEVAGWIKRKNAESDEEFIDRICIIVSEKFGGYSISHVSGRYRAATIKAREEAAKMLVLGERYIIDETTASVRFIIPIQATEVDAEDFDSIDVEVPAPESDVIEEIRLVHLLFFHLFVESIVRMVRGEDEIWLVEETSRGRSLYTWQKA